MIQRYRIEMRVDGKCHAYAIGEPLSVFWNTWELAWIYIRVRIRCDAQECLDRMEDDLYGLRKAE